MKIYLEDTPTYPAVIVLQDNDPAPEGYDEITSIVDMATHGLGSLSMDLVGWTDKLSFKTKLKGMIYAKMGVTVPADVDDLAKWDLLDDDEKSIAAHYFVIGRESFFLEVKNDPRYWVIQAGEYRCWTQELRTHRAELCDAVIFLRMQNLDDAKSILADLNQIAKDTEIELDEVTFKTKKKVRVKRLNRMYIEGLRDAEHDGIVAIKDWINSTVGTPFENNGFKNLAYPFAGAHTAESVAAELTAILDGAF